MTALQLVENRVDPTDRSAAVIAPDVWARLVRTYTADDLPPIKVVVLCSTGDDWPATATILGPDGIWRWMTANRFPSPTDGGYGEDHADDLADQTAQLLRSAHQHHNRNATKGRGFIARLIDRLTG